ncbi:MULTISPECIES: TRAP transporter substrate-binding protein [unclassified Bradyrhizobium]|uniref:TRAP transporter substrate-binding protein n=1 Tax=unclassified Bradyrhizobium TaxID=2631580 RepID=UPI003394141B
MMKAISRRTFALTGACALITSHSASAQTAELKVSHFLPPNHTFQKAMVAWSDDLEKQSAGRMKLRIYPAGQLGGGPNRQFDAARNGVVDIAISLHGATPGRYAMTELASLPFASPSAGNTSTVASRRLSEVAPDYLSKEHEGLRVLWMAVTPPLMFHSKAPLRTIADFKGKRIRYAGVQFKNIIDSLGAVPLLVPPQETQDGLAKGIIDAATFPYEGAASFDIATIAKYTLEPGVSSATFAVVMNPAKYGSLPDDLRTLIDKTTGPEAAARFGAMWDEAEREGKVSMLAKGTQVSTLAEDQLAQMKGIFKSQVEAALAEVENQGKPGRKFFAAYLK